MTFRGTTIYVTAFAFKTMKNARLGVFLSVLSALSSTLLLLTLKYVGNDITVAQSSPFITATFGGIPLLFGESSTFYKVTHYDLIISMVAGVFLFKAHYTCKVF